MRQERWLKRGWLGAAVMALAVAAVAAGPEAAKVEAAAVAAGADEAVKAVPKVDPQAEKVLRSLAEYAQGLKRFSCDVSLQMVSEMEGMKQEITSSYAFAMERPNKLALRHVRGMAGNTVVCDGKTLTTYVSMLKRYEEREAPKALEELFQTPGPVAGNMLFLDNLLRADVYAAIMDGVQSVSYAGKEQVDGRECDRLRFVQEDFDWDLWVTTGKEPVVLKALSDMSKGMAAGMDAAETKGMKMTMLNRLSGWRINPELPADTFVFTPPPGAKKTDALFEGDDEPVEPPAKADLDGNPVEAQPAAPDMAPPPAANDDAGKDAP